MTEKVESPSPFREVLSSSSLGSSVIPVVNKLQDIVAQLGAQSTIDLPQVAVVGSQSSGKSSVLEALVGRDFLPRGNDICTRRPLVLQLLQTKSLADCAEEEWGEFLHLPGKRFFNFAEIRREIEAETDKEAGNNKGLSDKQIRLKIFSPKVLDMTLVDLPGITKVPVGDQPSDIETRIRTMILSYIQEPSCLILAVTPANSDLANSDALQIAKIADPDGDRTIGVITKLDIMDRGTDARNLLLGKVIPLRLGYVGVVNRSQEDIVLNRSVKDALSAEAKLFCSLPAYNGLAEHCGVPQLAKKLNQILVQHIKKLLPGLKSRISSALMSVTQEHASYGEITESKIGRGALLLKILSKYCEAFCSIVDGKSEELPTSELYGGARINFIFQSIFVKNLEEIDPYEGLTDDGIRIVIQNATGLKSALFVPEVPFDVLVRRQIVRFLDPSLQCARFIYEELVKISRRCLVNELQRFPVLRKKMDDYVDNILRNGLGPAETMIAHLIEMEMDYVNTSHPNFIGGSKAVEFVLQEMKSSKISLSTSRPKDLMESDKVISSDKSANTRSSISTTQVNGSPELGVSCSIDGGEKTVTSSGSRWGIPSFFRGTDSSRMSSKEIVSCKNLTEIVHCMEETDQGVPTINLKVPPSVLQPSENCAEQESVNIAVTKLLLRSYYDIVRKNVQDLVPKAIMHFLVQHTKRELHNMLIRKLYRENLFEELLQEPDELTGKRKRALETMRALQLALKAVSDLPLEVESAEMEHRFSGEQMVQVEPTSTVSDSSRASDFSSSPSHSKFKRSAHSKNLHSRLQGNPCYGVVGLYPPIDS